MQTSDLPRLHTSVRTGAGNLARHGRTVAVVPHLKSLMALLRGRRRLLGGGDEVRRKTMWQLSGEESVRVETRVYAEASLSADELLVLSDVSLAHRARHRWNI